MNYFYKRLKTLTLISTFLLLTACGFHLQGAMNLAAPMYRLYLQSTDPYGYLSRTLQQYLKMSQVHLVDSPSQAQTILTILQDTNSQRLLSVSGTQQTKQYNLKVTVAFEVSDASGRIIVAPQILEENRVITVQANQILGSSNEANLYFQQMRRTLAYAIMNRLASRDITTTIESFYSEKIRP